MRALAALCLLLLGACATPRAAPGEARPQLTPSGVRLFHEVALTLPERGEESLLGTLVFPGPGRFTLRAETPFGLRLFEVGREDGALWAKVAPPLEGKFDAVGLARGVWRIYAEGCARGPRCTLPSGAELVDEHEGAPARRVRRTITDPGGTRTTITYERWASTEGILHPRRIEMRAGDRFRVEILLSGLDRL